MASLGVMVKALREALGLTQAQLAALAGVKRPWLSRVEIDDIDRPDPDMLRLLAPVLQVPADNLLAAAGYNVSPQPARGNRSLEEIAAELSAAIHRERDTHYELLPGNVILIPIVESFASAGEGAVAGVEFWPYIPRPDEVGHDLIGATAKGDCLYPRVRDGERIVIDRTVVPKVGDVVAAQVDGESLLRIFHADELTALNGHPPIPMTELVHIEGVVVFHGGRP